MVITGTVNYVVAAVASTVRTVLITSTSRGSTVVAHSNNTMKKDQELKMECTRYSGFCLFFYTACPVSQTTLRTELR